jgi:hypothetical protein
MADDIILRNDDDGALDEVVATNAYVHLERMDDHWFCLAVEKAGRRVLVNVGAAFGGEVRRSEVRAEVYADENVPRVDPKNIERRQMEALGYVSLEAHDAVAATLARMIRALQKQTYAAKQLLEPLAEYDPAIREWLHPKGETDEKS